jgi:hypothetical protein
MGDDEVMNAEVRQGVFLTRIIVFALATGVATYLTFVLIQGPQGKGANPAALGAVFFAVGAVVTAFFVPTFVHVKNRTAIVEGRWNEVAKTDAGRLAGSAQITIIIKCALLEGAAFFNVVMFSIYGQAYNLVLAVVLLILILLHFPSKLRWERWLEDELRLIQEQRGK